MLVFIDESGCAGFKLTKGSSPYFVVSMVIFDKTEDAERVSTKIKETKVKLAHKPDEFKFSSSRNSARDGFFEAMTHEPFKVRAIVINKNKLYSTNLRNNKNKFYNYFVQLLLKHDNDTLTEASIKIDGSGDRVFKTALNTYLRQQIGAGKIRKVKFEDSKKNSLIQLADMTAGAISRAYNKQNSKDHDRWLIMLRPKIEDLWEFPS